MWIYHQFINFLVALNHEKGDSSSLKQPSEAHCIEFLSQPIAVGLAIAEGVPEGPKMLQSPQRALKTLQTR